MTLLAFADLLLFFFNGRFFAYSHHCHVFALIREAISAYTISLDAPLL